MEVKLSKRPASPTLIRNYLRYQATVAKEVSPKFRGVVVAEMEKYVNSVQRKVTLAWLFERKDGIGMLSSNDLTPGELAALHVWIEPIKVDDVWTNSLHFAMEFRNIARLACRQYIGGEHGFDDLVTLKELTEETMKYMMRDAKEVMQ